MDSDEEAYILLLLSDGNLPTGSFVASAGLESYVTHGFFTIPSTLTVKGKDKLECIVDFVRDNMSTYARSALPFVSDAHLTVQEAIRSRTCVALLSLISKGFSPPRIYATAQQEKPSSDHADDDRIVSDLVDRLKLIIRREDTPFLHLFLCARGVLSAAVRMNIWDHMPPSSCFTRRTTHRQRRTSGAQICERASKCRSRDVMTSNGPAMTWPWGDSAARHDLQHSRVFNS
ncbi:hypothetical protein BC629DRAFT_1527017 [Irpex lacteus]|nr:hypothetical protein BC629DRAFT_1527017 [Irpex lacteus]